MEVRGGNNIIQQRTAPLFPEGNYTAHKNISAKDLADLFFKDEMLETIAASSNAYWGKSSRYSRPSEKYVDIPQPHLVKIYNHHMGGVDCFDQNQNHHRIKVGGKKWYWSA